MPTIAPKTSGIRINLKALSPTWDNHDRPVMLRNPAAKNATMARRQSLSLPLNG